MIYSRTLTPILMVKKDTREVCQYRKMFRFSLVLRITTATNICVTHESIFNFNTTNKLVSK